MVDRFGLNRYWRHLGWLLLVWTLVNPASASSAPVVGTGWIEVTGVGALQVLPDSARLRGRAVAVAASPLEAKSQVDAQIELLLSAFEQHKLNRRAYAAGHLTLGPEYRVRNGERELIGYQARRGVSVEVSVGDVGPWLQKLAELGLDEIDSPHYFSKGAAERRSQLLRLAIDDAKTKARVLAQAAGSRLGSVLEVTELDHGPMPRMALMAEAGGGRYLPGEQSEQVSYRVKFALESVRPVH